MNKNLILTIVCLIAVLGILTILIVPTWQSIKIVKTEITERQEEVIVLEDLINKTEQLKQNEEQIAKEEEKVFLALPKEKDIPALLIQFEALASVNGLILESINFAQTTKTDQKVIRTKKTPEAPKTSWQSLSVDLTVSGSYEAFRKYLANLENNIRSVNVTSISFSSPSSFAEGITPDFFDFNLKAEVYYRGKK
jgi:Tfp pilus assembly protein PilO